SYRTSAIASSDHHGFAFELAPYLPLRLVVRAEPVEDEERRAEDRRRSRRSYHGAGRREVDALRDRRHQRRLGALQEAATERLRLQEEVFDVVQDRKSTR